MMKLPKIKPINQRIFVFPDSLLFLYKWSPYKNIKAIAAKTVKT